VFSAIFDFGELNLRCKLNWLSPAKLPAGSWGEYNLAVAKQQFSCENNEQFCYEVISLMTTLQVCDMLIAKEDGK